MYSLISNVNRIDKINVEFELSVENVPNPVQFGSSAEISTSLLITFTKLADWILDTLT